MTKSQLTTADVQPEVLPPENKSEAWLKRRMRQAGLSHQDFGERAGLEKSTVTRIANNQRKVSAEELPKFAQILGVTVLDLLKDITGEPLTQVAETVGTETQEYLNVPVIGQIAAGVWLEELNTEDTNQVVPVPRTADLPNAKLFGLQIQGESMNRVLPHGSIGVFASYFDMGSVPSDGDLVYARVEREDGAFEATVKRLKLEANGQSYLWPESDHPEHQQLLKIPADTYTRNVDGYASKSPDESGLKFYLIGKLIWSTRPH